MAWIDQTGEIVRVTLACLYPTDAGGQQVEETNFCFQAGSVGGTDSRALLGGFVAARYVTRLLLYIPSVATFYGHKESILQTPPPAPATSTVGLTPGIGNNNLCPTQARPYLSWKAGLGGRGNVGRNFLFSPDIDTITAAGAPKAAFVTAANLFVGDILAPVAVAGSTWNLCLVKRTAGPPVSYSASVIAAGRCNTVFATQRRSGSTGRVNVAPW